MAATYDEAVAELYRGPHATFVAERKRLAGELKAAGDKAGATAFGKLGRPPISAWAVNQLWWQARPEFDALLETAKRMREGDLSATAAHREATSVLRARAAKMLIDAGNAANDATLRRVAATLSAIAAHGGFGADPAGALSEDRDPPGFEAAGIPATVLPLSPTLSPAGERETVAAPDPVRDEAAEAEAKRQAEERRKREQELGTARAEVERIRGEISALQRQVMEAEGQLVLARARVAQLELQD